MSPLGFTLVFPAFTLALAASGAVLGEAYFYFPDSMEDSLTLALTFCPRVFFKV